MRVYETARDTRYARRGRSAKIEVVREGICAVKTARLSRHLRKDSTGGRAQPVPSAAARNAVARASLSVSARAHCDRRPTYGARSPLIYRRGPGRACAFSRPPPAPASGDYVVR
ncbi:hypothetical protein EVAR_66253_1 [Eumeta japonica]|uniref:Uncharacterized protein n=1 Tax=Eumeta variegata TaxID=151549 RepID=A0A4C1ZT70_EUMVA|nr:hypothetical protein EVAR_66253_1 [Eumeta japonica]